MFPVSKWATAALPLDNVLNGGRIPQSILPILPSSPVEVNPPSLQKAAGGECWGCLGGEGSRSSAAWGLGARLKLLSIGELWFFWVDRFPFVIWPLCSCSCVLLQLCVMLRALFSTNLGAEQQPSCRTGSHHPWAVQGCLPWPAAPMGWETPCSVECGHRAVTAARSRALAALQ